MAERLEDFALSKKISKKKGTIQKVAVIGCGSMGQEITRIISQFGMEDRTLACFSSYILNIVLICNLFKDSFLRQEKNLLVLYTEYMYCAFILSHTLLKQKNENLTKK